jgi:hypothetical protein
VQMAKSDPEAQRKYSLSDCTWFENKFGSFNLQALKFLMHFRELGSSLYFFLVLTFFSFSHTYIFSFSLYSFFFLFLSFSLFLFPPFEL